jgi:branched-chain amino acid transport system permease protein
MFFQLTFNTIVSGLLLSLVAIGFNFTFYVTKVFHFSHGALYIAGAYVLVAAESLNSLNSPILLTYYIVTALSIVVLLAFLIDWLVYQPLTKKKASQAITLISSLGVNIFLVNLIILFFSNDNKFSKMNAGDGFEFIGLIITHIQLIQLTTCIITLFLLLLFTYSRLFLKIRAVMSQETVASILGINTKKIRLLAMIFGSLLASIAGILNYYDTGINPQAGIPVTLSAVVVVMLGGKESIKGTIIAALFISFLLTTTEWFLSQQWKDSITFFLLIITLLWKTEGFVSFKMRVEEN